MNNVEDIQTLLKKQRAQMRVLMKMQNILLENQHAINKLILQELKGVQMPNDSDKLLSPSDAAKFLNISASTLARKKKLGEIPYIQSGAGKKVLYSSKSLVEFMKSQTK